MYLSARFLALQLLICCLVQNDASNAKEVGIPGLPAESPR